MKAPRTANILGEVVAGHKLAPSNDSCGLWEESTQAMEAAEQGRRVLALIHTHLRAQQPERVDKK